MIEIEKIRAFNFEGAFRGLRNPLESWSQSDSIFYSGNILPDCKPKYLELCGVDLGEKDLKLAQKLVLAGSDHSKFMRQIFVVMDINAPIYYWKEMIQYHIGCTTNSESTMHKLATTPITRKCFSFDEDLENFDQDLQQYIDEEGGYLTYSETIIRNCERLRQLYLGTKDIRYWRALIQLLPESWNQKRTWSANYQVLRAIYFARKNHKLSEWKEFCTMIEGLPYSAELICYQGENK